jgi:hypothetical protein
MMAIGFMQLTHGRRVAMLLGLDNPFVCIGLVAGLGTGNSNQNDQWDETWNWK